MPNYKAVVDFTGYTGPALSPVAQNIQVEILAHVATFATPPVTMAALQTLINTFDLKLAAKSSRATADYIAFDIARHNLEAALSQLGDYVNTIAQGDLAIISQSGFPYYDTTRTADPSAPAAPLNVRLRQGNVSGEMVMRYQPQRSHSVNEVQKCTGDPNVEANWVHAGIWSGGKATLAGITPGTNVWVRVRTVGLNNVMGAWSDPAKIMVT